MQLNIFYIMIENTKLKELIFPNNSIDKNYSWNSQDFDIRVETSTYFKSTCVT